MMTAPPTDRPQPDTEQQWAQVIADAQALIPSMTRYVRVHGGPWADLVLDGYPVWMAVEDVELTADAHPFAQCECPAGKCGFPHFPAGHPCAQCECPA